MYSTSDCCKYSESSINLSIRVRIIKMRFSVLNTLKENTNETKYTFLIKLLYE